MKKYKHILLATDMSDASVEAVKTAQSLADAYNAKLSLAFVIEDVPPYSSAYVGMSEFHEQFEEETEASFKKYAAKLNINEENQFFLKGSPKKAVIKLAEEQGIDLIVVGSHGKHGLSLLLGSNSTEILHAAHCDVIVARAK